MNQENLSAAQQNQLASPTRVRYGVLGFVCALSMITYLDRVCFGAAASHIIRELNLQSIGDLKWAITAFAFAYAAFEIPSGWLGDVYGPRNVLIRIVLWWSLFTALTGFVGMSVGGVVLGVGTLVIIRFFFGIGEAGAYPNITRALHNWFPYQERGFAQGTVWMSGRLMGGLTPLIWALLVEGIQFSRIAESGEKTIEVLTKPYFTWRGAFILFGVIGTLWCIAFALWFRNRPEEKATVNEAELRLIKSDASDTEEVHTGVPWMKLLTSTNLWALCLMYFCAAYGWYFNITYLHRFLEEQFHVDPTSLLGAVYKGGPLWMGAMACIAGGWLTDTVIRRTGNRRWGRRMFGMVGHGLCGCCYLACSYAPTVFTFFLAISFAAFWNDMTMGSAWAVCQDIGKRYAAIVAGAMNTVGNLGGAAAGWVTGQILENALAAKAADLGVAAADLSGPEKAAGLLPGYHLNFFIFAIVYFVAVFLWMRVDATEPVAE